MRNGWIFDIRNYREVMSHQISENNTRGYKSAMARAADCQPAYLSQVMREAVELTPEQACGLCEFWQFSKIESDYFLTLVNLGRTGSQRLRDRLSHNLEQLKMQHDNESVNDLQIENRSQRRENAFSYYLDWVPSAVHVCLMIPNHNNPSAIAKRLRIDEATAILALNTLEDLGIAEKELSGWRLTTTDMHIADESLFAPQHHRNWREKVTDYFRRVKVATNYHYTAIYCLDRVTYSEVRKKIMLLVNESRASVLPAAEETVACLNIDWFEI